MITLYNSLSKSRQELKPIKEGMIGLYTCGPTVYNHAHVGNLASFIYADLLKNVLNASGYQVQHVMNFTDVDDKTISRSQQDHPGLEPMAALLKTTRHFEKIFLNDLKAIGIDTKNIIFLRATENISKMQTLIKSLLAAKIAYMAKDGIYFSINAYKSAGKKYGQLVEITAESTGAARVQNDEYDKNSIHDFALWKAKKEGEPAWDFKIDNQNIPGRPGWHIECSAMSASVLGQPFDIHTGGVDLKFPHHENEIAQSTAINSETKLANYFMHNEHMLVIGKKMSKSLNNFFTLDDIKKHGFDPLAFRLLVLQSHYRSQMNFTWEALEAAENTLNNFKAWADLQFQSFKSEPLKTNYLEALNTFKIKILDNLKTPDALAYLSGMINRTSDLGVDSSAIAQAVPIVEGYLGLGLNDRKNITSRQRQLIGEREKVRKAEEWQKSDQLRQELAGEGIEINDTNNGPIWHRK
jgi:cysteinyl-tRNA synthetase